MELSASGHQPAALRSLLRPLSREGTRGEGAARSPLGDAARGEGEAEEPLVASNEVEGTIGVTTTSTRIDTPSLAIRQRFWGLGSHYLRKTYRPPTPRQCQRWGVTSHSHIAKIQAITPRFDVCLRSLFGFGTSASELGRSVEISDLTGLWGEVPVGEENAVSSSSQSSTKATPAATSALDPGHDPRGMRLARSFRSTRAEEPDSACDRGRKRHCCRPYAVPGTRRINGVRTATHDSELGCERTP